MFAHLHLHTEYSLLDGANRIGPLLDRVQALGMNACAITDHGVMYGAIDFYKAALARGIHPVIGCEVYICPDMHDKSVANREYNHLILLCENDTGYHNLCKLVSMGFTEGFYYRPRIDYAHLRAHHEGLIGMSACLSGDIPRFLLNGREEDARARAREYADILGPDHFYIEIQDHGIPEQRTVLPQLIQLAQDTCLPLVATNDCHYLTQADAQAQEILMGIQTGKTLNDPSRMRMQTDQLYVKSEAEMRAVFPQLDEAIERTQQIAERCQVTFDFETKHLPRFPLPEGQSAFATLREQCEAGLKERYPDECPEARERLDYELATIQRMGYVDYFLIVWDFIRYARANGILVGPGRGSGAGSIVAYTLHITNIDPLKYQLVFERFLNPERISMPDLDIDFDYERRGEVIDYVAQKYGPDHVAQIITFGTMAAKQAIRDVGRVMDMSYAQTDAIAKMVPFEMNATMTLDRALAVNPQFKAAYEADPQVHTLIDTARTLEGMPRHASTHAAGVLITARPVSDYVPLQTNENVVTTQYPMNTLESLGLLKMDFLGLRTLNVINDSLTYIAEGGGPALKPEDIPLDDPAVYAMISAPDTDGVFQLEGSGMKQFLGNMRPENFEDIIAAISLYRPGPMEAIPRYIEGKRHPDRVQYRTPLLRPILDVTYGCMVYQEQVMQIVRDLAGYSMGRSDLVRRAMAKKKHDVMQQEKTYFIYGKRNPDGSVDVPGAIARGVSERDAEALFDEMTAFASYAFNKSHAAAYALVAVQTAWLKCHYPCEFMAAMMNSVIGNTDKVAYYIQYCRKQNIPIWPPDVNASDATFRVDTVETTRGIRFGLNAIKNLGHAAVEELIARRTRDGAYRDLYDLAQRISGTSITKKAMESLIKSGALSGLPGNRAQKLSVYERVMDAMQKRTKNVIEGQMSLFGMEPTLDEALAPALPDLPPLPPRQKLSMEKEVTGVYITGHPLNEYESLLATFDVHAGVLASLAEEQADHGLSWDQRGVQMGGIIVEFHEKATKSGNIMGFLQLEDMYGVTEVLLFPKVLARYRDLLATDAIVRLSGHLSIREEEAPKLLLDQAAPLTATDSGSFRMPTPATTTPNGASGIGPGGTLYLKVARKWLDGVEFILETTPGPIRVVYRIPEEARTLVAPRTHWVAEDCDIASLKWLLGTDAVVWKP